MKWNEKKLDACMERMKESVREFVTDKDESVRASGEILGFWLYELQNCKEGAAR